MESSAQTIGAVKLPYMKPDIRKGPLLGNVAAQSGSTTPSDIRLKHDIAPVGRLDSGLNLYRFRYLGGEEEMVGVMAQEVLDVAPEAVVLGEDGFYRVDYARLGAPFSTYAAWLEAGRSVSA